jgi:predicted methyltransferase
MAPELYTEKFYRELKRVLKPTGTLWHYSPNPGKMKGKDAGFRDSIKKKLSKAGFKNITYDEESLGFICQN